MVRITSDEGVVYLCVDCNLKYEQAEAIEFNRNMQMLNVVGAALGMTTGIQLPRFPVQTIPVIPVTNMNLNNFNIDNSVIGVLNTGNVRTIDHAITYLTQVGETDVARVLKVLTEGVAENPEISTEQKNQIVELVSTIASEAQKPEPQRRLAVTRALVTELGQLFSGMASASYLWVTYGPTIKSYFGF
jgi:hypothetical protein